MFEGINYIHISTFTFCIYLMRSSQWMVIFCISATISCHELLATSATVSRTTNHLKPFPDNIEEIHSTHPKVILFYFTTILLLKIVQYPTRERKPVRSTYGSIYCQTWAYFLLMLARMLLDSRIQRAQC